MMQDDLSAPSAQRVLKGDFPRPNVARSVAGLQTELTLWCRTNGIERPWRRAP